MVFGGFGSVGGFKGFGRFWMVFHFSLALSLFSLAVLLRFPHKSEPENVVRGTKLNN